MTITVVRVPPLDSWLTDGVRLVRVVAHEPNGELLVEDARAQPTDPPTTFRITTHELSNDAWLSLDAWKAATNAA